MALWNASDWSIAAFCIQIFLDDCYITVHFILVILFDHEIGRIMHSELDMITNQTSTW